MQKFCNFDLSALQVRGKWQDGKLFSFAFSHLIYQDGKNQGGEKAARCPLLFSVQFSSRHINNLRSRLSPLPLGPAAVRLSYCRSESAPPLAYYVQGRIVDKCLGACLTALFLPPSLPLSFFLCLCNDPALRMAAPRVCQVQFLVAYLEEPGIEGLFL